MLEFVNRANTDCYKWDSDHACGTLPLWVADMDFKAAEPIVDALRKRVEHGVFGYTRVPDSYYEAMISWFDRRHGWKGIRAEQIIYTIGVVPAVSAILKAMTKPGDKVLVHTPAYNCFFSSIRNLECERVDSPLIAHDGRYEFDWADMEAKLPECRVLLLCNPHNPCGRVWTRDELTRLAALCQKYNVFVISDEIHCELAFPGVNYVPYATVSQSPYYCVCTSASKAFNIAGLQCANIFVPDAAIYSKIDKAINIHEICDINPFGFVATIAAYNLCEGWLDELRAYIADNYAYLCTRLDGYRGIGVTKMEGTYLAWLNIASLFSSTTADSAALVSRLATEEKVLFCDSEMYGATDHIRINLATSREVLEEAVNRLINWINNHE